LSVIYDATIAEYFKRAKKGQIPEYVKRLKEGHIYFEGDANPHYFTGAKKHVWIITRSQSVGLIDTIDGIKIQEVPYHILIDMYTQRMSDEIGFEELSEILKNIEHYK
jgi:hypothetical protein